MPKGLFFQVKGLKFSRLSIYRRSQPSTEWLTRVLTWDAQNGSVLSMLLVNLIIDFGDWGQMCKDLMIAILEYYGYIIPA